MQPDLNAVVWPGWQTTRLIGQGGFGAVYEIQRNLMGEVERAALKVISIPQNPGVLQEMRQNGYDDEGIRASLQGHLKGILAEYSLMRKLNGCSNIVSCDDVRYVPHRGGMGWNIYIKMELLTPLTSRLEEDMPQEEVIRLALDMCTALEMCAKYDILHRDIKPQNIFISPTGSYKLGDFGIAKTAEKVTWGTQVGTHRYMAPEVFNNQPYGASADIYSLGLVLYSLLNHRRMPFLPPPPTRLTAQMDETSKAQRLSGAPIPPPAQGSPRLQQIVLKACAFRPEHRYRTAAQMKQDLEALLHGKPMAVPRAVPVMVAAPVAPPVQAMPRPVAHPKPVPPVVVPPRVQPGASRQEERRSTFPWWTYAIVAAVVFSCLLLAVLILQDTSFNSEDRSGQAETVAAVRELLPEEDTLAENEAPAPESE